MRIAARTALALSILSGERQWSSAHVLADYTREAPVLLDPETGNELRADAMPAFVVSTDGEASDGNIVRQHWDLSRAEAGIAPILVNHRTTTGYELGVGLWRDMKVEDTPGSKGQRLIGRADFDLADPAAAAVAGKVRRGYVRAVSVGWRPGHRVLRGDLDESDPFYRKAERDECGTRVEGFVMGSRSEPNQLIEGSVTPIPADPAAAKLDGRTDVATRQLEALAAGERVVGLDLSSVLLALRDNPAVRQWARNLVQAELIERGLVSASPADQPRTLATLFARS